jgi:cytohesin
MSRNSLHSASQTRDINPSLFLKAGLESQSAYAGTPLHTAVSAENLDAVKILLKLGVDPNVKNEYSDSLLHNDAAGDSSAIVEKLLKAGAGSDALDYMQMTPLMMAARTSAMRVIPMLIGRGRNSTKVDSRGKTVFHHASQYVRTEAFKIFLDAGWDPY